MKKLRLMLIAIAMLSIIGGIFAFKAHNSFGSLVIATYCTAHTTSCNVAFINFTTTTVNTGSLTCVYYTTGTKATTCITTNAFLKPEN
jgi:hypothetical protein